MPELFKELADNAPVMIWRAGTDKFCDFFNKPWIEFTGRPYEKHLGMGWLENIHPEDREECLNSYVAAFEAREPFTMEYRLIYKDGSYRWVLDKGKGFKRNGRFAGYIGSAVDIDERKRMEAAQDLMVGELNHRVKNNLSVMQGLIHQTAKRAASKDEMEAFLIQRLRALARAHELLALQEWQDMSLRTLVSEMARMVGPKDRVVIRGSDGMVSPYIVEGLAITLYEMFLNAVQHGALSNDLGRISIDLVPDNGGDAQNGMLLVWREDGGPPARQPNALGLGLKLMKGFSPKAGSIIEFLDSGVSCTLAVPLKS